MLVLLDNGHGIDTLGKQSPDGRLKEYEYAREIVKRIHSELENKGINSIILVPEEKDISLTERCNRANKYYDNNDKSVILISVHCNAAGNGDKWMTARGWEAWTSVGETKSDELAELLYSAAEAWLPEGTKIRTDKTDGDRDKEKNFTILYKTKCPAVLTENLFQDNKEDVEFMLSEEGKRAIVNLHVEGIVNYLTNNG